MKNFNLFLYVLFLLVVVTFFSCSREVERPKISLNDYSLQAITAKGVVEKLLNESDYKKMHEIALAVESSRAIDCIPISDECNILGMTLNKIIKSTAESLPKEADNVAIYKLINQLNEEFQKGQEKLSVQWREYLNSHPSDSNSNPK